MPMTFPPLSSWEKYGMSENLRPNSLRSETAVIFLSFGHERNTYTKHQNKKSLTSYTATFPPKKAKPFFN